MQFRCIRPVALLAAATLAASCGSATDTPIFTGDDPGEGGEAPTIDPADLSGESPTAGADKPGADAGGGPPGGGPPGGGSGEDAGGGDEPNCAEAPYDFGCPCEATSECITGFCVQSLAGYICTIDCVENCPDNWSCLEVKTGVGADVAFVCVPTIPELCATCASDDECGGPLDRCVGVGASGSRCGGSCAKDADCPEGYACEESTSVDGITSTQCLPVTGSCECTPELDGTKLACFNENEHGTCMGLTTCDGAAGWTECTAATPAPEICDGVDNNCNGIVDETFESEPCFETNEFGSCVGNTMCLGLQGVVCTAAVPAPEKCDGVDNNCDGFIDQVPPGSSAELLGCTVYYYDGDGDGYGVDDDSQCLCSPKGAYTATKAGDCDDDDATIHPGAAEKCDGVDNNCNGLIDEGVGGQGCVVYYFDGDGDGYGVTGQAQCLCGPDGNYTATQPGDCNDEDATIHPGAAEKCDGIDNDCNGLIDDGEGIEGCNVYYLDADKDGFAGPQSGCFCAAPPHWYDEPTDCNDNNNTVYPGAPEICDGLDNNCDGYVDVPPPGATWQVGGCTTYYFDGDGDGYGVTEMSQCTCKPEGMYTATIPGDCDDNNPAIHPGAPEVCDGIDNNCNGLIDEGTGNQGCTVYFADADGDGFGVTTDAKCLCGPQGVHTVTKPGDCDDGDPNVFPGAPNVCNGVDTTCAGQPDFGCDKDGDGWCDAKYEVLPGAICPHGGGDCDDFNPNIHPGAQEICDGIDNNCNGLIDEGVEAPCGGCALVCQLDVGPSATTPFDTGGFGGVGPNDQGDLVLDKSNVQFHMLWVANSGEDTISKIDTESGKEVGRYRICGNPSRTAVDLDGNCYAGCRSGGGVAKILLDPNTCVDKNGNGVIETSYDANGDGVISGSEILPLGQDECVAYITVPDAQENIIRAVAVDKDNYPWVGGWDTRRVYRLNPNTGALEATVNLAGLTTAQPYGFAIDQQQRMWISLRGGSPPSLGMIDLAQFPLTPQIWGTPGGHQTYGIAIDSLGKVWLAGGEGRQISRFDPVTQQWSNIGMSGYPNVRGVAASTDGKVYAAHYTWGAGNCPTGHYISVYDAQTVTLSHVIDYSAPGVLRGPVGLSFDFSGYLWAINQCGSSASKIDPTTGQEVATFPTGSGPYTYSDMTGFALKTVVAPEGTYTHTFKGWEGQPTQWFSIAVGATTPVGTYYEVEYRAAESTAELATTVWSTPLGPYPPGNMPINLNQIGPVTGKYLQVRVTLVGSDDQDNPETPLLKSIDVVAAIKQ